MALSYNGKTIGDSDIETLSAKIGIVTNKRKAVCLDCGHTWEPRSSNTRKPSLCSKCKSRNCAWEDELHTVKTAYPTAALMATVNGEPVTVEPLQNQKTEERQNAASTIASGVIRQLKKDEASNTSEKFVKSVVNEVINQIQGIPETSKKSSALNLTQTGQAVYQIPYGENNIESTSPEDKEESSSEEINKTIAVNEALRTVFGDSIQIIDKPVKNLSEGIAEDPKYAVWRNEDGSLNSGVILNPETFEDVKEILEEKNKTSMLLKTDEHLDRLDRKGLLDIENVLDEETEEEEEDEEDYEEPDQEPEANGEIQKTKSKPVKKSGGSPIYFIAVVAVLGAVIVTPLIIDIVTKKKKSSNSDDKKEEYNPGSLPHSYFSIETPNIPNNILYGGKF